MSRGNNTTKQARKFMVKTHFINTKTLRQRQNCHNFADDILNAFSRISINISLKFVPKGQINIILAGGKPLSEPMIFADAYMRQSASMS